MIRRSYSAFFFSISLDPVGARWIREHYTYDFDQGTFSYYGPINRVALNMGYHNEHHDLPSIPLNNLPRLRAMAPELYVRTKKQGAVLSASPVAQDCFAVIISRK